MYSVKKVSIKMKSKSDNKKREKLIKYQRMWQLAKYLWLIQINDNKI